LALCSLPLPPGNKEPLGQITPLHVVTFGAYISLQKENNSVEESGVSGSWELPHFY
jgi:hypothetical protein